MLTYLGDVIGMGKCAVAAVGGAVVMAVLAAPGVAAQAVPPSAGQVQSSGAVAAAMSDQDSSFLTKAEQVNLAEITIGELALKKATTPQVRSLAQETLADHQDAKAKMEELASRKGVTLPTSPSAEQQSTGHELEKASGAAFDTAYLKAQVSGHEEAAAFTRSEIGSGGDADVQAFAKDFLPAVLKHLNHAQEASKAVEATPKGANTGTGGLAERIQSSTTGLALMAGGLAIAAGAGVVLLRRRFG
ncbi:DUF4142 domain-containing protein [Saccharopolyspora sp. NPDC002686]|uniref:DUF4142 domain-containing protein n=1 Tax=Saccharopolyspora sp. NPDC002686 TaxID=3154541 RepID=UPI003329AB14